MNLRMKSSKEVTDRQIPLKIYYESKAISFLLLKFIFKLTRYDTFYLSAKMLSIG